MEQPRRAVGIDLGTTNSVLAEFKGHAVTIRNMQGESKTPSCVAYHQGKVYVGKQALKDMYAGYRVQSGKRLMGLTLKDEHVAADAEMLGFTLADGGDKGKVVIKLPGQVEVTPVEVSARILANIAASARRHLQLGPDDVVPAVVTVPAHFKYAQKRATKEAAMSVGIEVLRMIHEPTAAAVAQCHASAAKNVVKALIFDLGGGTLDVTIVRFHAKTGVQCCAIDGDMHLGGIDFDNALAALMKEEGPEGWSDLDIRAKAIAHKHEFSDPDGDGQLPLEVYIDMPSSVDCSDSQLVISRKQFDDITAHLCDKAMACVDRCLQAASMPADAITTVVLIGGSSRLPRIRELLEAKFGADKVPLVPDPDEIVAHGAAIFAATLTGALKKFQLSDVAPHSVGIRVEEENDDDVYSRIVRAGERLPFEFEETYTIKKNKSSVVIDVYEGENSVATENELLDTFTIRFPAQPERRDVKVCMTLTADGVLHVTARVGDETGGVSVDRTGPMWGGDVADPSVYKEDDQSFEAAAKRKRGDE